MAVTSRFIGWKLHISILRWRLSTTLCLHSHISASAAVWKCSLSPSKHNYDCTNSHPFLVKLVFSGQFSNIGELLYVKSSLWMLIIVLLAILVKKTSIDARNLKWRGKMLEKCWMQVRLHLWKVNIPGQWHRRQWNVIDLKCQLLLPPQRCLWSCHESLRSSQES